MKRSKFMSVEVFSRKYNDYLEKQDRKAIVSISVSIFSLMFLLTLATFLPFKDAVYNSLFPKPFSHAAAIPPSFVQSITSQISTAGTSVNASFPTATTNGNFLIATLTANAGGGTVAISSAPTGWVQASSNTSGGLYQFVYYYPNAPSISTPVSFTLSTSAKASLVLSEYKDVATTSPLDNSTTSNGTSTTPTNSLTPTTTDRFIITALSSNSSVTFASPSAGFTIATQSATLGGATTSNATSGLMYQFTSVTTPVTSSVTTSSSSGWIATSLAFKVNQTTGTPSATDWPQLQHDSQHTGRTTVTVNPNYSVAWAWFDKTHIVTNFGAGGTNKSLTDGFGTGYVSTVHFAGQVQPIIANNMAYFGSMNGTMYAVDSATGTNKWDFTSGGPILGTAAFDQGIVIFASMDGKVYGLNGTTGAQVWQITTNGPVSAAPVIMNGTIYIGSRGGSMYALDVLTGIQKWKYDVRDPAGKFNNAVILAPAALSEDGATVVFGAENMNVYALNTSDGSEKWTPKAIVGQSFNYSWPVIKGNDIIIQPVSSMGGTEYLMESVLDGISATPSWTEEKTAVLNWLNQNPHQKGTYVFDVNTGNEPFQVAMGRVEGENYPPFPPVVDNSNKIWMFWHSKVASAFKNPGSFGTKYCSDMSVMNPTTGDRSLLPNQYTDPLSGSRMGCPEQDNGFQPTIGGNWMYLHNTFRGIKALNVTNGSNRGVAGIWECNDGGCGNRGGMGDGFWGSQIIYYGNDSAGSTTTTDPRPYVSYIPAIGFNGITVANASNGIPMLYVNEINAYAIVAIKNGP